MMIFSIMVIIYTTVMVCGWIGLAKLDNPLNDYAEIFYAVSIGFMTFFWLVGVAIALFGKVTYS